MRRSQVSDLLTVTALFLLSLGMAVGWLLSRWLPSSPRPSAAWLPLVALSLVIVSTLFWLYRSFRAYFLQIKSVQEDAALILHTNPERRATPQGPAPLHALAITLNGLADRLQTLQSGLAHQIEVARAELAEEHQLLTAILAESSDSMIVCNLDGQVLLYNQRARQLLSPTLTGGEQTNATASGFIGLGRSLFTVLDRNFIAYALGQLQSRLGQSSSGGQGADLGISFVTAAANGALLRIRLAPLERQPGQLSGFVLNLQDLTQGIAASRRRDLLLQRLTERFRGGLANIRVASETLADFPTMPATYATQLQGVIGSEATALSAELDQIMREFAGDLRAQWRSETLAAADLLRAIQAYVEQAVAVQVVEPAALWLRIDHYTIVHGVTTAIRDLQQRFGITQIGVTIQPLQLAGHAATRTVPAKAERFASLDVRWSSGQITAAAWLEWKERVLTVDASDATLTLREVAERHGSEVWFQHDPATAQSYFRLLLPLANDPPVVAVPRPKAAQGVAMSRPEYYDFDLFHQPSQKAAITERLLTELPYTVFDTETTGLDPTTDQLVAIGAVRIVNGRLLYQELFEQLIDPQCPMPAAAEAVHGISDTMVRGQPRLTQVLPHFMRFAEETVLLGHNVAFDLRLLAVAEPVTGIKVTNPVLDTLLLSAIIQPDGDDHRLEALAERLGVNVVGRHTALGDALVTAEIFLRMLPLLRAQGILTLADALAASQRTYFARLQY